MTLKTFYAWLDRTREARFKEWEEQARLSLLELQLPEYHIHGDIRYPYPKWVPQGEIKPETEVQIIDIRR